MHLIFGLGNPGKKYEHTRHNMGFMVLEEVAKNNGLNFHFDPSFESETAELNLDGRAKLVKPMVYMNDSGRAVLKVKNFWKIQADFVWVIYDDVDLDFGKIRINFGGSSAGHKGAQSIIDHIGEQFWRIRVGVGKDSKIPTDKWVLKDFSKEDFKKLPNIIDKAASLVIESLGADLIEKTIKIL